MLNKLKFWDLQVASIYFEIIIERKLEFIPSVYSKRTIYIQWEKVLTSVLILKQPNTLGSSLSPLQLLSNALLSLSVNELLINDSNEIPALKLRYDYYTHSPCFLPQKNNSEITFNFWTEELILLELNRMTWIVYIEGICAGDRL